MPWGNNPANDPADAVRALAGDMDSDSPLLADSVYRMILKNETKLHSRAALACSILAGKYAKEMNREIGKLRRYAKVQYEHYRDLAAWYRLESSRRSSPVPFVGGLEITDRDNRREDTDIVQPEAYVGKLDSDLAQPTAEDD